MEDSKRRDWYDEIYDDYKLNFMNDGEDVKKWTPYGRNSIDITFKNNTEFRYNYFTRTLVRIDLVTSDDMDYAKKVMDRMLSNKLNKAMQDYGMTQKDLAEKIGITESAMSLYCNGKRIPNVLTVSLMAMALKCELYDLIPFYDPITGRIK